MPTTTYTFDTNLEGWRSWDKDTSAYTPHIEHEDEEEAAALGSIGSESQSFATPASFAGDQSSLIGGSLEFDIYFVDQGFSGTTFSQVPITLRDQLGNEITANVSVSPAGNFDTRNVQIDLTHTAFGVTEAQFASIMGNLQHIAIDADAGNIPESWVLDNVAIASSTVVDGENTGENMGLGYDDANAPSDGGGDKITTGNDSIRGNGGNDTIDGAGGNDTIDGGDGDDSIVGGSGSTSPAMVNLITNGDFSATSGSGSNTHPDDWTVSETDPEQVQVVGGTAYFGGGDSPAGGSLTQLIDGATIGQPVNVSFDYFENGGGTGDSAVRVLITDGNGNPVLNETVTNPNSYSYSFTATTTDYTVQLIDASPDSYQRDARVDNFEVNVPNPNLFDDDSILGGAGNDTLDGGIGDDTVLGGDGNDLITGDSTGDQNLINNGTFTGSDGSDPVGWQVNEPAGNPGQVQINNNQLVFNGSLSPVGASVSQEVDGATPGEQVTINFDFIETGASIVDPRVQILVTDGNGNPITLDDSTSPTPVSSSGDIDTPGSYTLTFTATTSDYTVTILDTSTSTVGDARIDNFEVLVPPTAGSDSLVGDAGNDTILGSSGNDTIDGGADEDLVIIDDSDGNATITGGEAGSDLDVLDFENAVGTSGADVTFTGSEAGTATIGSANVDFSEFESLDLTSNDDTVDGSATTTGIELDGQGGADQLTGGSGADTLDGGEGNDTLVGGDGNDSILGGPTAGTPGIDGADSIEGGQGNDTIDGGEGNDVIDGGADDDVLIGGFGGDTFRGGLGDDTMQIDGSAVEGFQFNISVDNNGDGSDAFTSDSNTYEGIEHFVASENNDTALPPPFGGTIPGNDTINLTDAVRANEVLNLDGAVGTFTPLNGGTAISFGGPGQPTLQDILDGNVPGVGPVSPSGDYQVTSGDESGQVGNISFENFETINFTVAAEEVDGENTGETMGVGYDDGVGATDGGGDLITNTADTIFGNGRADTISAGDGDDVVYGGTAGTGGDTDTSGDEISGEGGNDTLDGGLGDDRLDGGADNDVLIGGDGNDTLIGGAGQDTVDMSDESGTAFAVSVDDTGDGSDDQGNSYEEVEHFLADEGGGDDTITLTSAVTLANASTAVQNLNGAIGTFSPQGGGTQISFGGPGQPTLQDILSGNIPGVGPVYPGGTYQITGGDESGQVGNISFENFEQINFSVICFARGTRIKTPKGEVTVENLCAGDKVLTPDNGAQPIRWIGSREFTRKTLEARPNLKPIRIAKGALGRGLPERDLTVSPQHRVLLRSRVAERMFGSTEVLIAAKKLLSFDGIDIVEDADGVEYFHFLCDQHELVWSEGAVTETLHTGPEALKTMTPESRAEIFEIFPELEGVDPEELRPLARISPKGKQIRTFFQRIEKNGKGLIEAG